MSWISWTPFSASDLLARRDPNPVPEREHRDSDTSRLHDAEPLPRPSEVCPNCVPRRGGSRRGHTPKAAEWDEKRRN